MIINPKIDIVMVLAMAVTTASGYTSQFYAVKSTQYITYYKDTKTARSPLACIAMCTRLTDCHLCAYDKATGDCFLHVLSGNSEDAVVSGVTVYGVTCDPSDAVNTITTTVSWEASGQKGEITCRDDYMYSADNTTIYCSDTGLWIADGTCRQRVWRNPTVNLFDIHLDITCHIRISLTMKKAYQETRFNDAMIKSQEASHFPFARGQLFEMEVRVVDNTTLQGLVDGTELFLYRVPAVMSATDPVALHEYDSGRNVIIHFVDLGSGC